MPKVATSESGSFREKTKSAPKAPQFTHTVRWKGETLSLIAEWYTGSWRNWRALAKANTKLNPKSMRIGDAIVIPEKLLKNKEPMPRGFSSSPVHKKVRDKSPSSNQQTMEEVLYAPI